MDEPADVQRFFDINEQPSALHAQMEELRAWIAQHREHGRKVALVTVCAVVRERFVLSA